MPTAIYDPVNGDSVVDVLAHIAPELLNQKCLDHGFVKVLDCMPRLVPAPTVEQPADGPQFVRAASCDFAIADAARISYQKGTRKVSADSGLIDNLIRNRHTSPIEMGELKFHIRLPIFVMRQHVRHRTASLNEESARYSELASDFYVPDPDKWAINTPADKQATVHADFTAKKVKRLHRVLTAHNTASYRLYQSLLAGNELPPPGENTHVVDDLWTEIEDILGIAREQARVVLGVNIYTQCVWKIDLKNLLGYLSLRCDKHAQYEIRVFADAIARVVEALFPACWKSHKDHDPFMDGVNFGASELRVVKCLLFSGCAEVHLPPLIKELGWTQRRFGEFKAKVFKAGIIGDIPVYRAEAACWPGKVA